jgi:3-phosphoshikimate 1-carboxyvinyltransferase
LLEGLSENSIQGDIECIEVFNALGVESKFVDGGLKISKKSIDSQRDLINFRNHPDLVQPAAIAAAALGLDLKLAGLDNLRLKESDRIQALQMELAKAGFKTSVEDHTLHLIGSAKSSIKPEHFAAHGDHRMAMSLASLAMVIPEIVIHDPMVVSKSYPSFWNQVEKFVDVRPGR